MSGRASGAWQHGLARSLSERLYSTSRGASTASDLQDYIVAGPLLQSCGITPEDVEANLQQWEKLGVRLCQQLGFDQNNLSSIQRLRVFHYYLPVFFWCQRQLQRHEAQFKGAAPPPLVLGISAPQGCGKTTLVEQLQQLFDWQGSAAASVSIDDFYLTNAQQRALGAAHPDNPLLQVRGNAGTHDLELGRRTLEQLKQLTSANDVAAVPRYDKSAFQGKGDRADPATWPTVRGPLKILFFEGWMLGFRALEGDAAAALGSSSIQEINTQLAGYSQAWDALVDSWLVVRVDNPQWVYNWRLQAELAMRASGRPGMSDEEVADFVSRYMPAYETYLPGLYAHGPTTCSPDRTLVVAVDKDRSPLSVQQQLPGRTLQ